MSIQGSLNSAVGSIAGAIMAKKAGEAMESQRIANETAAADRDTQIKEQEKRDNKYINKSYQAYGELLSSTRQNDPKGYKNLISRQQEAMDYAREYQNAAEFQRQSMNARIAALRESGMVKDADEVETQGRAQADELYENYKKRLETLKRGKK